MKNKFIILTCFFAIVLCMLGMVGCGIKDDSIPSHTHTYATKWSYDEDYHWHKATCEHISEVSDKVRHSFENNICVVCRYNRDNTANYAVTFNANNGSFGDNTIKTINVVADSLLGEIDSPTREGYLFCGWALNENGNKKWDLGADKVNGNITLYAIWQEIPSTIVKINYYNGDKLLKSEDFTTGGEYTVTYNPIMIGYKVVQWKKSDGKVFEKGIITEELNLYAEIEEKTYNVYLDVNQGKKLAEPETTIKYNEKVSFAIPTREGHEFLGWYYKDIRITDKKGKGLKIWNIDEDCTIIAKWQANEYIVALNNMSPSSGTINGNGTYEYGSEVTVTASENKGYNFVGWFNEDAELVSEDKVYSFTMTYDITLTAKWSSFTVTTRSNNADAGTVTNYNKTVVSIGEKVTLTATTKNGYTFVGWYDDNELLTNKSQYSFDMPKKDVVYTAKWIKVSLESDDTMAGTVNVLTGTYSVGDSATAIATTKAGYTFIGWYNGEVKVSDKTNYTFTMPTTAVTYTAKWIKVSLESDDTLAGTVNVLTNTYSVGDSATAIATTKAGYTFIGWYNGEVKVCDKTNYIFTMPTTAVTYTAKWIKVTFNKNISAAGNVSDLTGKYVVNDKVTVTANTNEGYTWLGWYNGEVKITDSEQLTFDMPAVATSYTAHWESNEYTVTLDANGGILNYSSTVSVQYGKILNFNIPEKVGYYFGGWFTTEKIKISSENGTMLSAWEIAEDTKLVAKWLRCITFNSNGGKELSAMYVEPGEEVTLPSATKTGYSLKAWLNNGTSCSTSYLMPDANITLDADWSANTYYIYYNSTSLKVTYGQYYSIPNPTKSGYTFRYFTLRNSTTRFAQSGIYKIAGSTDLDCKWLADLSRTVSAGCTISESSRNLEKGMTFTITYSGALMKNFHIETNTAVNVTFTGPGWTYSNTKNCGINSGTNTGGGSTKMVMTITIIDPSQVSYFSLKFTCKTSIVTGEGY